MVSGIFDVIFESTQNVSNILWTNFIFFCFVLVGITVVTNILIDLISGIRAYFLLERSVFCYFSFYK